ncbi:hypothetical protein GIB67_042497 [Kingdonia uniflora]|uniref:Uncharacterized protein n=1 Tax=Kingdonia uniflora TaxID=39325 RepID=A0A7J7M181_9MAGN|nr:hypothetical protein GIB67_042497 [Kingdonia uniflora]
MVLWEITLGTAYFLGLRRSYRLALKLQRRYIEHPKIKRFLYGFKYHRVNPGMCLLNQVELDIRNIKVTEKAFDVEMVLKGSCVPFLPSLSLFLLFFDYSLVSRRTRAGFDVALRVHRNIQQRDLEVGRNFRNWILRLLDRMKPSAQIRGDVPKLPPPVIGNTTKQVSSATNRKSPGTTTSKSNFTSPDPKSGDHVFLSPMNAKSKLFATKANTVPSYPASMNSYYRNLCICGPEMSRSLNYERGRHEGGVVRKDIMQWMLRN